MKTKKVVIILGNRLNDDGSITEIQKQRLELALEIEKEFNPDYYILSGSFCCWLILRQCFLLGYSFWGIWN